ncbi:MAG: dihydrolipoyl dehydrogenase [Oscillospiraceae bacterium]
MQRYDLVILGAGPGGYAGAIRAAQLGLAVALVEKDRVGGTCLNRGCVPTKALLHAAELYHEAAHHFEQFGIGCEKLAVDAERLYAAKDEQVSTLRGGIEQLLQANGVTLFEGTGRVAAPGRVEVEQNGGKGTVALAAKNIMAAVGAAPVVPPIPGAGLSGVFTSDGLLSVGEIFPRLVVIGGGVIGVEFATLYALLGCGVTLVEAAPRILPALGREAAQSAALQLKKQGVQIYTGATVQGIEKSEGALACNFTAKEQQQAVQAEAVLVATGRRPALENLFAEGAAPRMAGGFVEVNGHFETSLPGLYAIGDITPGPQLAHAATAAAITAVEHMAGHSGAPKGPVPSCLYTLPEIAVVGLNEEAAAKKGIAVTVQKFLMGGNARVLASGAGRSYIKLLAEAESGRLLGAEMVCPRATDMIATAALAIQKGMKAEELDDIVYPHPTFSEGLGEAAALFKGAGIHTLPPKKRG